MKGNKIPSAVVQKLRPFFWRGGFGLLVELHQEGSSPAACASGLFHLVDLFNKPKSSKLKHCISKGKSLKLQITKSQKHMGLRPYAPAFKIEIKWPTAEVRENFSYDFVKKIVFVIMKHFIIFFVKMAFFIFRILTYIHVKKCSTFFFI